MVDSEPLPPDPLPDPVPVLFPPIPPAPPVEIGGFWRRLAALIVDFLVLGVVGWAVGHLGARVFIAWPLAARVLGLAILLAYEGLLTGPLGRGQTLGKQLLDLRVVGPDAAVPPPRAAWARTLVKHYASVVALALAPLDALGVALLPTHGAPVLVALGVMLLAGPGVFDVYRYLGDGEGRQSLHDRLARTWVVRAGSRGRPIAWPLWQGHYMVTALLVLGVGAAAFGVFGLVDRMAAATRGLDVAALASSQRDLGRLADDHPEWPIRTVDVGVFGGPLNDPGKMKTQVTIGVATRIGEAPRDHVAISRALARRLLAARPELRGRDGMLRVVYTYGFSLVIYGQGSVSVVDEQPLAAWLTDATPKTITPFAPQPRVSDRERV